MDSNIRTPGMRAHIDW